MSEAVQTLEEIRGWLVATLGRELKSQVDLDPNRPLADYGLESRTAIGVTAKLEDWLEIELDPTMFFDYPSIDELARFLRNELRDQS